ncbi:YbaB/EbfC family nucleoid-associated protein [Nocardia asteroides]|uniref:YbaB/EbfC family nucleoid-associated protein n=1 Tax=Nocardia asteroides TaxID=1824 RepID=UPI001E4D559B|nr:YbaB/EbfC family nucleoid-associated protein [Nocardia asteroides]UGT60001.1 YbaB/EbfC family nucleoid-associated protein [Nocardia asteroides]
MVDTMDELLARVQNQIYRLRDLGDSMNAVRATETSPDGAITVEVDGNGALLDLRLTGAVARLTPAEFEHALVATARAAVTCAFAERGGLITAFNAEQNR